MEIWKKIKDLITYLFKKKINDDYIQIRTLANS